jgi:hypothetical protein
MKCLGFLSVFAIVGLEVGHGQAVKDPVVPATVRVSSRLQLIASLEQATLEIGSPIILHYRLKNVSSERRST